MKSIVVATDGSAAADRAVGAAAELAAAQGAKLTIVNVQDQRTLSEAKEHFAEVELPKTFEGPDEDLPNEARLAFMRLDPADLTRMSDRHTAFMRQYLSDSILSRASKLATQAGAVEPQVVSATGEVAKAVLSAAETADADLIVVGRRGLGTMAELLLGSVSQKILHKAHTNVLAVA